MYKNASCREAAPASEEKSINPPLPFQILCCGFCRLSSLRDGDEERPQGREAFLLLYFHAGQAHFYFEGAEEAVFVHAGQMLLIPPGGPRPIRCLAGDEAEIYWVYFDGSQAESLLGRYRISSSGELFPSGVSVEYKDAFLKMFAEMRLQRAFYEDRLSILLQEILLMTQRRKDETKDNSGLRKEIEEAASYFTKNYNKEIVIQDYAREHFLSPYYFSRNFKKYTGLTPARYLLSLRISHAQSLLEDPAYTITEIARMVGYKDPLYFSRIFKKHVGVSPRDYRLLQQRDRS